MAGKKKGSGETWESLTRKMGSQSKASKNYAGDKSWNPGKALSDMGQSFVKTAKTAASEGPVKDVMDGAGRFVRNLQSDKWTP
jgi:photosystem II stability/assembly factor-like uncharacterized protein